MLFVCCKNAADEADIPFFMASPIKLKHPKFQIIVTRDKTSMELLVLKKTLTVKLKINEIT